jgi:hypothetical protein
MNDDPCRTSFRTAGKASHGADINPQKDNTKGLSCTYRDKSGGLHRRGLHPPVATAKTVQVIHQNRFITSTRELSRARCHPPSDPLLGYMITNFNHITFENGNVLEMTLDWCVRDACTHAPTDCVDGPTLHASGDVLCCHITIIFTAWHLQPGSPATGVTSQATGVAACSAPAKLALLRTRQIGLAVTCMLYVCQRTRSHRLFHGTTGLWLHREAYVLEFAPWFWPKRRGNRTGNQERTHSVLAACRFDSYTMIAAVPEKLLNTLMKGLPGPLSCNEH